jgi:hypothetical protein
MREYYPETRVTLELRDVVGLYDAGSLPLTVLWPVGVGDNISTSVTLWFCPLGLLRARETGC